MNKTSLILALILFNLTAFSQENDSLSKSIKAHTDVKFGYKAVIPDWLNLRETGSPNLWGGTMEPIGEIENAIIINGFTKRDFKNIKKLKFDKIEQYKMGDKINNNQTFMLQNELGEIENVGDGYKVQILTGNKLYHCTYVFAQTKNGFLWIIFTATPETYDINFEKFKVFLNGLELIKE